MSKMDENFSFKYYGYDRSMSSVTEIPWSQKKAPLSVKLDIADNPVLSFYNYAQSYRTAAHLIAERMLAEAQIDELDNYFFPVFFMYRHSVELLLKSIGFKVIPSKSDRIQFMKDTFHDLLAITKYILAHTTIKRPHEEEMWLLDYFRNIASFDKESDSFRYPFHIVRDELDNDLFRFEKVFSSQTNIDLVREANKMEAAFEIIDMWYHDLIETGIEHRATEYRICPSSFLDKGGSYYEQSVVGHNPYVLDFYPYYTGYKECANYIMKYVTSDIRIDIEKGLTPQHISDNKAWLFYPMCYLYRNAIELLQKSIIIEFSDISVTEICKLIRDKKHSICGLYTFIEKEIYCLYEIDPADNYINIVKQYCLLLHSFDSDSSRFRYPINKQAMPYQKIVRYQGFDALGDFLNKLCNSLEDIRYEIHSRKDAIDDMMHEYESYNDY